MECQQIYPYHIEGPMKAEILIEPFHAYYTREDTSALLDKEKSPYRAMKRIQVYKDDVLKLLAQVLTAIFQSSLIVGELRMELKDGLISSIYKKGDRCSAANYRPVSLTCVVCKILEDITRNSVMKQMDKYDIITDKQHGFRRRRSYEK